MEPELTKYYKMVITKKLKYGEDYFKQIGSKGGKAKVPKGFSMNTSLASKLGKIRKDQHARN